MNLYLNISKRGLVIGELPVEEYEVLSDVTPYLLPVISSMCKMRLANSSSSTNLQIMEIVNKSAQRAFDLLNAPMMPIVNTGEVVVSDDVPIVNAVVHVVSAALSTVNTVAHVVNAAVPAVSVAEALVNVVEPVVNADEVMVNVVDPIVDTVEPMGEQMVNAVLQEVNKKVTKKKVKNPVKVFDTDIPPMIPKPVKINQKVLAQIAKDNHARSLVGPMKNQRWRCNVPGCDFKCEKSGYVMRHFRNLHPSLFM